MLLRTVLAGLAGVALSLSAPPVGFFWVLPFCVAAYVLLTVDLTPRRAAWTDERGEPLGEPARREDGPHARERTLAEACGGENVTAWQSPGEDSGPSDRPTRCWMQRAGSYLASQASPGSTRRGAGPTSANHVGLVGGAPTNRLGHSDVGPPTRSAWANEERDLFVTAEVSTRP